MERADGDVGQGSGDGAMNIDSLRDELAALRESIAATLTAECSRQAVHDFFDTQRGLDERLWAVAAEQGWLGIGIPEAYGGLALGAHGLDILYRQLGRNMAPGAFIPTLAAAQWLADIGTEALKSSLLPQLIRGGRTFALPLTLEHPPLPLRNGELSGLTSLLLSARSPSIAIVPAQEDGVRVFALIECGKPDAQFVPADIWDKTRCVGRLTLSQALPLALITERQGSVAAALRHCLCLAAAGDCVGGARALLEQTVEYLKQRVQFGRPLASFQALKHRCANLAAAVIQAGEMLDQAVHATSDREPSAGMWACLAKAAAGETLELVAQECLQLHGGVGFTWEYDCHIFLKRALLNRDIAGNAASLRDRAADYFTAATLGGQTTAELRL